MQNSADRIEIVCPKFAPKVLKNEYEYVENVAKIARMSVFFKIHNNVFCYKIPAGEINV